MNEPVACMEIEYFRGNKSMTNIYLKHYDPDLPEGKYELYTHPVKELTDEEIEKVWYEECSSSDSLIEFARAILRKAQEK